MLNTIIYNLKDDLYCAAMLGGEAGLLRKKNAITKFHNDLKQYCANGIKDDDVKTLLTQTIYLNSEAFLTAVKLTANFNIFSQLLDDVEPELNIIYKNQDVRSLLTTLSFFNSVLTANPVQVPDQADFLNYKKMRDAMKSRAMFGMPKLHTMNAVIDEFLEPKAQTGLRM